VPAQLTRQNRRQTGPARATKAANPKAPRIPNPSTLAARRTRAQKSLAPACRGPTLKAPQPKRHQPPSGRSQSRAPQPDANKGSDAREAMSETGEESDGSQATSETGEESDGSEATSETGEGSHASGGGSSSGASETGQGAMDLDVPSSMEHAQVPGAAELTSPIVESQLNTTLAGSAWAASRDPNDCPGAQMFVQDDTLTQPAWYPHDQAAGPVGNWGVLIDAIEPEPETADEEMVAMQRENEAIELTQANLDEAGHVDMVQMTPSRPPVQRFQRYDPTPNLTPRPIPYTHKEKKAKGQRMARYHDQLRRLGEGMWNKCGASTLALVVAEGSAAHISVCPDQLAGQISARDLAGVITKLQGALCLSPCNQEFHTNAEHRPIAAHMPNNPMYAPSFFRDVVETYTGLSYPGMLRHMQQTVVQLSDEWKELLGKRVSRNNSM
jgi:hypothetical protein